MEVGSALCIECKTQCSEHLSLVGQLVSSLGLKSYHFSRSGKSGAISTFTIFGYLIQKTCFHWGHPNITIEPASSVATYPLHVLLICSAFRHSSHLCRALHPHDHLAVIKLLGHVVFLTLRDSKRRCSRSISLSKPCSLDSRSTISLSIPCMLACNLPGMALVVL